MQECLEERKAKAKAVALRLLGVLGEDLETGSAGARRDPSIPGGVGREAKASIKSERR